jgi:hypothetical protein
MTDGVLPGLTEAGPSTAVEVMGLNMVPSAGDEFTVAANESEVRSPYAVVIHTHSPSENSSIECASELANGRDGRANASRNDIVCRVFLHCICVNWNLYVYSIWGSVPMLNVIYLFLVSLEFAISGFQSHR